MLLLFKDAAQNALQALKKQHIALSEIWSSIPTQEIEKASLFIF